MVALQSAGKTTRTIAAELTAAGVLTRYGKPWNAGTIAKILARQ